MERELCGVMEHELAQMCLLLVPPSSLIMISTCAEQALSSQEDILGYGAFSLWFFISQTQGDILPTARFLYILHLRTVNIVRIGTFGTSMVKLL